MSLIKRNRLKKLFIVIQLLFFAGSLHGAEYSIIDPENLITDEQENKLAKNQEHLLQEQDTLVSYAFYNVDATKIGLRMEWESNLKMATEDGASSEKFHLLICVGVFSKQNTVDIFYKNQPALEDGDDLNTCIASLKQSLGSEPEIKDFIEYAPSIIQNGLSYLNERPEYEKLEHNAAEETRTREFMKYILGLVKIALIIIVPIIAFLIFWYIFGSLNNRRAHHFPIVPNKTPKKRLGAPYAATSISQTSK